MTASDSALTTADAPPGALTGALGAARPGSVGLRGVTKRYGTTLAVDDLDLDVHAGEFLSLLGPSGCGKTTTLRMLAGFEHPDAGSITISGAPVDGLPPHRREVNTVFQAYALFPHMSVAENVAYGLRQRRVPRVQLRERVTQALALVRMSELAGRSPRQLSGGQAQRVALARALVNRPAVLLLDEPMSALDRKLREEMQVELKLLQSELRTTFVFVTHDQEEALTMSDRVAVLDGGRLEQVGTPDDVYDHPASAFVAGFIGKQNFFDGAVAGGGSSGPGLVRVNASAPAGAVLLAPAPYGTELAAGATVTCAVRPEAVRVRAVEDAVVELPEGDGPEANRVLGSLAGVSHLGHTLQLVVLLEGGRELLVRAPRDAGTPTTVGSRLWCTWSPSDVHVFRARQT